MTTTTRAPDMGPCDDPSGCDAPATVHEPRPDHWHDGAWCAEHAPVPPCRCGAPAGADPHPCHGFAYTCRAPARSRFVQWGPARLPCLAGVQMKVEVSGYQTWACDACWARTAGERGEAARADADDRSTMTREDHGS